MPLMAVMQLMFKSISIAVKCKQLCNNINGDVLLKRIKCGYMALGSAAAVQRSGLYIVANLAGFIGLIGKFAQQEEMQVSGVCHLKRDRNRKCLLMSNK